MTLVVTEAVVLHAFDYLESSRILRVATRDAGVLSVLARGARKPRSKFGSALDLFVQGSAHLQVKPARELQTLVSFDVTRSRATLAFDLERFVAASAFAELTLRVAHDESHQALFDVVSETLDALAAATPEHVRGAALGGCWQLIAELGFSPAIDRCCVCHADAPSELAVPFSYASGGIVCERCRTTVPGDRQLPSSARDALRRWLVGAGGVVLGETECRAHLRLLREFAVHHLGDDRELRAFANWERGTLHSA